MTKENVIRLYKHFCYLAKGKFVESDFDQKVKTKNPEEEEGRMIMGPMSADRRKLIITSAERSKAEYEKKNPWLLDEVKEEVKKPKSKEKPKAVK